MKNWKVEIEKIEGGKRVSTIETLETIETIITRKQFDKLLELGSVNTKHGWMQLKRI